MIKVLLDSAALERLIGGDTQVEADIRQSVAVNFAKRHLKEVANSKAYQEALHAINMIIQKEVEEQIGKVPWSGSWQVNDRCKEAIKAEVQSQVRKVVRESMPDAEQIRKIIAEEVDNVASHVKTTVSLVVNKQIVGEVERRLKVLQGGQPT